MEENELRVSRWWLFLHHCVAHPLMGLCESLLPVRLQPKWPEAFHDYTAERAFGGGEKLFDGEVQVLLAPSSHRGPLGFPESRVLVVRAGKVVEVKR